jgi:predicted Zn finger-like uncharacterized protein
MIITCPNCGKRYTLKDGSIKPPGRTVKCASCGTRWHQDPEAAPAPAPPTTPAAEVEPPAAGSADAEPPHQHEEMEPPPLRPRRRGPNAAKPAKKEAPIGWIVVGIAVLGLTAALLFGRESLVSAWPPSAKLYETVGLAVPVPGHGLAIRNVVSERRMDGTVPVLVIIGDVVNTTNEVVEVPRLKAALRDANKRELQFWTFTADSPRLLPGESANFSSDIANPSSEAVDLTVTFTNS